MTVISISDTSAAVSFLESVQIDRSEQAQQEFEALGAIEGLENALPSPPVYTGGIDQLVTVGSQIAEFSKHVPVELRLHISNSFLLAQLAANYEIRHNGGGPRQWYNKYVEVLANIGWIVEDDSDARREITNTSVKVHTEIIEFLTVALGSAVAASAVVLAALKGLQNMAADQPWITIFERESQRASVDQFQISYVDAGADRQPRITIGGFELSAEASLTQFLFFRTHTASATLDYYTTKLATNPSVFEASKDVVEKRVAHYVKGYATDIPI